MTPPRMPDHEVHGDGDTTLFLLHGAYGSKEYFRDLTAALVGAGLGDGRGCGAPGRA